MSGIKKYFKKKSKPKTRYRKVNYRKSIGKFDLKQGKYMYSTARSSGGIAALNDALNLVSSRVGPDVARYIAGYL